jgi:hypothetical protein
MVHHLYDLKTLRREFLRLRKHPGGRKDQRFLGKVAERQSTYSASMKNIRTFSGPRRWSPDRTLALILAYFVAGVGSLPNFIFYQTTLCPNVASYISVAYSSTAG